MYQYDTTVYVFVNSVLVQGVDKTYFRTWNKMYNVLLDIQI